jgi:tyrosyl-tRNA synthetase
MSKINERKKLEEIFGRGLIVDVLPSREAFIEHALASKLNMFIGFDPTFSALHLGHAQNVMLMEEFRKLGHKVSLVFGDFTACIGDPSGRSTVRKALTRAETTANAMRWKEQVKNLMDFGDPVNPPKIVFNSESLDKISLSEFIELASETTVQRMMERDMFAKRLSSETAIHLHEFLYPLMQGFDSVALNADVEVCGTDQTFNALLGRQLVKSRLNKDKFCLILQLMTNPITGEPMMSKSFRKGVFLDFDPEQMFGGIMALPDVAIEMLLKWNTRIPLDDIKALDIENNPRDAKVFAATEIVRLFHGDDAAMREKNHFIDTFSKNEFPADAPIVELPDEPQTVFNTVKACMPDKSNSDLRRLIEQGAVSFDEVKMTDPKWMVQKPKRIRIGKLGFFKTES